MFMSSTTLLSRYFDRLGYSGTTEPTLELLRQLHELHPQRIPFENLAPYNDLPVPLTVQALDEKLLQQRRGGYCFEHNTLFQVVLEQLGYEVVPLIARVRWQVPAQIQTGLTHMLLGVRIDGRLWFADVSFGSTTQTAPLALIPDMPQRTPHGYFRVATAAGKGYSLEFQTAKGWREVYQFNVEPAQAVDYELGNWYTSTHPDSLFKRELIVSRTLPGARELLHNTTLSRRSSIDGSVSSVQFLTVDDWASCLLDNFGLALEPAEITQTFARMSALKEQQAAGAE